MITIKPTQAITSPVVRSRPETRKPVYAKVSPKKNKTAEIIKFPGTREGDVNKFLPRASNDHSPVPGEEPVEEKNKQGPLIFSWLIALTLFSRICSNLLL